MLLMLLYSVRKRVGFLRRLGPLSRWLDGHIFLGVFGPLLVMLHSSFKVQGLVALSFWSMVAVALERGARPLPLPADPAHARRRGAGARGARGAGPRAVAERCARASASTRRQLERARRDRARCRSGAGSLGGLGRSWSATCALRAALRAFARSCRHGAAAACSAEFERVVRQKAQVRRRIVLWDRAPRALPLLARAAQAVRRGDVPVHGRPRRGGARDRLRLGGVGRECVAAQRRAAAWLLLALAAPPVSAQISPGPLSRAAREARGQRALPGLPRRRQGRRPVEVPRLPQPLAEAHRRRQGPACATPSTRTASVPRRAPGRRVRARLVGQERPRRLRPRADRLRARAASTARSPASSATSRARSWER